MTVAEPFVVVTVPAIWVISWAEVLETVVPE